MKRQIMKSIYAFCTGVMTLVAASSLVVSCYDDTALWEELEETQGALDALDERVKAIEALKDQITALTSRVDALYTLQFQVSDSNELQYSFDGGKTWKGTGIVLVEECDHECPEPTPPCDCVPVDPCSCPEVSLVDNGDSVTIKVGDASFTIEKPQEIVFDIRAGKVYFASESTQKIAIKTSGVADLTVMAAPKGWYAEIASDGMLEVTAPDFQATVEDGYWNDDEYIEVPATAAAEGYVKIHACGVDGKCMVGKLPVVVSNRPVSVKAYGGTAYFNAAGTFPSLFYYGASPKESFETEVAELLDQMNSRGWADWNANGDEYEAYPTVEASIEELLGAKIEDGKEYVVYALVYDYSKVTYTMEDFIVAYYSVINVTAVEDEALRTAYNVTVTVNVEGAQSYYAYAIPGMYVESEEDLLMQKEYFIASFSPDSWSGPMGKLYNEAYTGSVLDICEGTNSYMGATYYAPDSECYLLVLPLDGRSMDEYTVEDVKEFTFKTSPLTSGGSVNASATQITKYTGEVWDNNAWAHVEKEIVLDEYSQLGVEVKPSAENWNAFYFYWLDDEEWNLYGASDETLVDFLLEYSYAETPLDIEFPYYSVEPTDPKTTLHFVAMFVDETGKYGELAKVSLTTKELVYSDILFNDPCTTNLVDGVLKNTTDFTLKADTDLKASMFKYIWMQDYGYSYVDYDDAAMAKEVHFSTNAVTVKVEDLVDGNIVVPNNEFGGKYYVAVLPYDEAGAPGKSAVIFRYDSIFAVDVVTEGADFDATKPELVVNLPTILAEFADGSVYFPEWQSYYSKYKFNYEFDVNITPKAGTKVSAVLVDAKNYTLAETASERTSQLLQNEFSSYYTYSNITEPFESSNRSFYNYEDQTAPDIWFIVSWVDAEGTYYYYEQSLQAELQKLSDKLAAHVVSPDGCQLMFDWEDMGGAPSCIDFGVATPGYLAIANDMEFMYGAENLPAEMLGMYAQYMAWEYEVTPTDAHSGTFTISSLDHFGEVQTAQGTYSEWYGLSCVVTFDTMMLEEVYMTVAPETIPVYIEQAGGLM